MAKMEEVLRAEIARLAKKELRTVIDPLSRDVRTLKRTVSRLAKVISRLERAANLKADRLTVEREDLKASKEEVKASRISGRVIRNLRKKLGISQQKLAVLVGVSPGAVALWEQGHTRPRGTNKEALVALRKLGRRDVKRILEKASS